MTRDTREAPKVASAEPLSLEAGPAPTQELATKSPDRVCVGSVVDGVASRQITRHAKSRQERDQLMHRLMTELPDAAAGAGTVPTAELRQFEIRFLQEKG
jgi:hypothetical protein